MTMANVWRNIGVLLKGCRRSASIVLCMMMSACFAMPVFAQNRMRVSMDQSFEQTFSHNESMLSPCPDFASFAETPCSGSDLNIEGCKIYDVISGDREAEHADNALFAKYARRVRTGNALLWTGAGLMTGGITLYMIDLAGLDNSWKGITGLAATGLGLVSLTTGIIMHCTGKKKLASIGDAQLTLSNDSEGNAAVALVF